MMVLIKYMSVLAVCGIMTAAASVPVGIFTWTEGTIQMKQAGSDEWQAVKKGDAVTSDCMLVAADGTAEVVFFDGKNKFTMLSKSAVKIKTGADGFGGEKQFDLKLGKIVVTAMGGKHEPVRIKTKTAEITAKKAKFIAAVTAKGNTRVTGLDGRANVKNPAFGEEATVAMGKEVISDGQGILQGATDKKRQEQIVTAAADKNEVKGNKKIVLAFKGEGKEPRNIEIMLKERN